MFDIYNVVYSVDNAMHPLFFYFYLDFLSFLFAFYFQFKIKWPHRPIHDVTLLYSFASCIILGGLYFSPRKCLGVNPK